ncbi:MAG: cytochrome c [Pseudomonadota bacterium]
MKSLFSATLLAAIAVTGTTTVQAAEADDAIKYRKKLMSIVGGSASTIGAILKGEAGRKEDLAGLAQILAAVSDPAMIDAAFEMNTDGQGSEKTTSTANIWSDWQGFTKISADFNKAALAAAAKGADVTFAEMKPVFATCKACHSDFRKK